MRVAVVTDSTADLPAGLAEDLGLRVVPMGVAFGDAAFISGVTLQTEEFYDLLARPGPLPTTSQPNPAWFEEAYADAADDGADAVVSVHVSGALSGTCDLARTVAEKAPLPVTVVDSRQVGGALALAVLAAIREADRGADARAVADVARRVAADARVYFAVDSLDYLRRGGRLTGAEALVGSVLRVKPILMVDAGEVAPLGKVRTWSRAVQRLADLAAGRAGGRPARVVVGHGMNRARARAAWSELAGRLSISERLETVIGPVLASHVGPGTVAIAVTTVG